MAYLDIEEMTTHIYEEDMDTISHGDDAAMMSAIDAAIEEVQGYLTKYDTGKIFAPAVRNATPSCYFLSRISQPGTSATSAMPELTSKCVRSDTTGQ